MSKPQSTGTRERIAAVTRQTSFMFLSIIPIVVGVVLLTGLMVVFLPIDKAAAWFGRNDLLDASIGALVGSVAAGHPMTSYVLGGELLDKGVSLVAVTALVVSWVTVGSIQLPAEALVLGRRFAVYRNLIAFVSAMLIGVLMAATLDALGMSPASDALQPVTSPVVGAISPGSLIGGEERVLSPLETGRTDIGFALVGSVDRAGTTSGPIKDERHLRGGGRNEA